MESEKIVKRYEIFYIVDNDYKMTSAFEDVLTRVIDEIIQFGYTITKIELR